MKEKFYYTWGYKTKSEALRHARAQKKAHKLGRDWKIHIHENMGWFWSFENGSKVYVHPNDWKGKITSYGCLLGLNHAGVYCGNGVSPQKAVHDALQKAKPNIAFLQSLADEAQRVIDNE